MLNDQLIYDDLYADVSPLNHLTHIPLATTKLNWVGITILLGGLNGHDIHLRTHGLTTIKVCVR